MAAISALLAPAARAEEATEYTVGGLAQPVRDVQSAECTIQIAVRGAVASVETRERLINHADRPLAVRARLAVPAGGVVVAASLRLDGAAVAAAWVPAAFTTTPVDDPAVLGADPLLVHAVAGDGTYATVQPIAAGHAAIVTTRYVEVAAPIAGGLEIVLPGRAGTASPRCRARVTAAPGPGARVTDLRVDHAPIVTSEFAIADAPVTLHVGLALAGAAPIVWTQRERISAEWTASLVTVLAPELRARPAADRVLFVIDGSRSMALVDRERVLQILRALAVGWPPTTEVEAIVYDRTAARVLGQFRPADKPTLEAIAAGVRDHVGNNGSDLAAAFALAHRALADASGTARVIAITDGMIDADGAALISALDLPAAAARLHAILLDPPRTASPGLAALEAPIFRLGGSIVELDTDDAAFARALATSDDWLRPAALALAFPPAADLRIPGSVRAGRGFSRLVFQRDAAPALVLTGHTDAPFRVAAAAAPGTDVAALALASARVESFAGEDNPSAAALATAQRTLTAARAAHPIVDANHALAALSRTGRIAASRRAVITGGGAYARVVDAPDLALPPVDPPPPTATASAIDKLTLERLFRDQLAPRAYACYQRALGRAPTLAGTATFDLHIGRSEVSHVDLTSFGDAPFTACLLDAAYALQPPLPDFAVNTDDQTIVHYPLSFTVRDDHPLIMAGDADSSSPIDIDAIQGGVPTRRRPVRVDPATPLGGLKR
jgi:hypothetical protein